MNIKLVGSSCLDEARLILFACVSGGDGTFSLSLGFLCQAWISKLMLFDLFEDTEPSSKKISS